MTAPIGSSTAAAPPVPPQDLAAGDAAGSTPPTRTGRATAETDRRAPRPGSRAQRPGVCAEALALEVLELETDRARRERGGQVARARSSAQAQRASFERRMEAIARAAREKAEARAWGLLSKVLKWIAAAAAAIAGIAGAVFSGGGTLAVAAVVIGAVLAGEQVVRSVTEALSDLGALSPRQASIVRAALGSLEDVAERLAQAGALGPDGKTVAAAFSVVVGAARAIVSAVFSGGSGALGIVESALRVSGAALRAAREVYVIVEEACGREGRQGWETTLALDLTALVLDVGGLVCGCCDSPDSSGGRGPARAASARGRASASIHGLAAGAETASRSGSAAAALGEALAGSKAIELDAGAQAERAAMEAAHRSLERARAELERIGRELEQARDDAEAMLAAEAAVTTPSRV